MEEEEHCREELHVGALGSSVMSPYFCFVHHRGVLQQRGASCEYSCKRTGIDEQKRRTIQKESTHKLFSVCQSNLCLS